jgi:cell division protein FtsL
MTRVNFILLAVLALCATGLVTSQHKARKLFTQLEKEQERARQLDVEWGQLQLEQSTWAMHGRVERVARQALHMGVPDLRRTQLVQPADAASPTTTTTTTSPEPGNAKK